MGILISEVSTPLVNLRSLFQVHKLESTLAFKLNDAITGLLFFIFRIILYPIFGYQLIIGFSYLVSTFNKSRDNVLYSPRDSPLGSTGSAGSMYLCTLACTSFNSFGYP